MPDTEVVAPATATEGTPVELAEATPPTETALTRTEVLSLIETARKDVESRLKQDIEVLAASTRRADGRYGTANAKIQKLETALEAVATRGMDESEARLWKAERAVERANETSTQVTAQQEYETAQRAFAEKSSAFLASEGIDAKDERLTASFAKYAAEAKTYADWDNALIRAVADVRKDEAKKATLTVKEQVEKAREEERAKLRNEQRSTEGKLDKGSPAAAGKVDYASMSDAEFIALEAEKTAERLRRQRNNR